jgi:NRPS condensation-like uncharacterized protein
VIGQAGTELIPVRPAAPGQPGRTRFAIADELTCYYDRPAEPANIHVEVVVQAALDPAGVRAAVSAVLNAEPALRVRRAAGHRWQRGYVWEQVVAPEVDPVRAVSYADAADLAKHRNDLLSQSPSLDQAPPFLILLASGPLGDVLMLNAHHACFDGLAALRLLRAVADEYSAWAGERPGSAALAGERSSSVGLRGERPGSAAARGGPQEPLRLASEQLTASGAFAQPAARPQPGRRFARNARIAADRGPGPAGTLPGYGARQLSWDGLADLGRLRRLGYRVNDVLVAALIATISEWNEAHLAQSGLVAITMPVGDKQQLKADGEWANRSRLTTVTASLPAGTSVSAGNSLAGLLAEVAAQTSYAKDHPAGQVDLMSMMLTKLPLPVAGKRLLLRTGLRAAGSFRCDSSLISNLGVVPPIAFGTALAGQVWFSTSAHLPRGLSVGAATTGGVLRLTFRYRRALLSDQAAADFAGRYARALDALAGRGGR